MNTISLRDRRQITLPAELVAQAGLQTDDTLQVSLINGVIQLVPTRRAHAAGPSMQRFLGAAGQVYGNSAEQVDGYVREQRDAW